MSKNNFVGTWLAFWQDEPEKPVREYKISYTHSGALDIVAKYIDDDERLVISNIKLKNDLLTFDSFLPSTKRAVFKSFEILNRNKILSKSTFTVLDELSRMSSTRDSNLWVGEWCSVAPHESDDYNIIYEIVKEPMGLTVFAVDRIDKEEMEINNVQWNGKFLTFESIMPSTERSAMNRFTLKQNGNIEAKFTFTVVEELDRVV